MSPDDDKVLKIHGERITKLEGGAADMREKQAADMARFGAVDQRQDEMRDDIKEIRKDVSDINRGVGETVGMLRKMNGHDAAPPSRPLPPPGAVQSNGKVIPMPEPGTKAYYLVLILYWGGIPATVIMGIIGLIWTLNQFGVL